MNPHIDCSLCNEDNNQEGIKTMFDTTDTTTGQFDEYNRLLEQAREQRDTAQRLLATRSEDLARVAHEIKSLRTSLQQDLADWAESNLDTSDDSYKELSELMTNNGLDGLKRTFTVTVRATYEFEVEVEASDEEEARDEVDNSLIACISENISLHDLPVDVDLDVNEA